MLVCITGVFLLTVCTKRVLNFVCVLQTHAYAPGLVSSVSREQPGCTASQGGECGVSVSDNCVSISTPFLSGQFPEGGAGPDDTLHPPPSLSCHSCVTVHLSCLFSIDHVAVPTHGRTLALLTWD